MTGKSLLTSNYMEIEIMQKYKPAHEHNNQEIHVWQK